MPQVPNLRNNTLHPTSPTPSNTQPPTMCLVVPVRCPMLGPLRRGPIAHTGAGCNAHFVHLVGMQRVQSDLCLISTHFNGVNLICWNQGDTSEKGLSQSKCRNKPSNNHMVYMHSCHQENWELKTGQSWYPDWLLPHIQNLRVPSAPLSLPGGSCQKPCCCWHERRTWAQADGNWWHSLLYLKRHLNLKRNHAAALLL